MGLEIWAELSSRSNKGKDEPLQPCIPSLGIMEDLDNIIYRLLNLPFPQNEYCTYCNKSHSKVKEKHLTKLQFAQ